MTTWMSFLCLVSAFSMVAMARFGDQPWWYCYEDLHARVFGQDIENATGAGFRDAVARLAHEGALTLPLPPRFHGCLRLQGAYLFRVFGDVEINGAFLMRRS